jgi:hypothetical protein
MEKLPFKTVHASVRPARVAILVDSADQDWQFSCMRIIEFYSQLWGGAHNIIVPTDGNEIDERFWVLLESFDPDYVYRYAKTGEDLFLSHPDQYNDLLERQVNEVVATGGMSDRDSARAQLDRHLRIVRMSDIEITPKLHQEVKIRLAPFWFQHWVVDAGAITAGSVTPFHLTNIAKIISNAQHPNAVASIEAPPALIPTLWFSAVTGCLNSASRKAFEQLGIRPEAFPFGEDDIGQLLEFTMEGASRGPRVARLEDMALRDLTGITPFEISMLELGLYRSTRYQAWQEPTISIVGNTFHDFCLYYCLSRLRDRVVWVLPSITEKIIGDNRDAGMSRVEMGFLSRLQIRPRTPDLDSNLACVTYSLSSSQVDKFIERLESHQGGRALALQPISKIDDIESLVRFPLSAIERDNFQRDISIQWSEDRSIGPFSTPKPKHFSPIHPYEHRYITQLSVVGDAPPKHFHLGKETIVDPRLTTAEVRVGKEGPAYFCPTTVYFGGDIDTVLVRPRLHLPPLHKIVEELAGTQGYECRPSDKGIYADESVSKWGGLEEISQFLRDGRYRALLDQFLDNSKSELGKGDYLLDRRRYLDFAAIKAIVGDSTSPLIDEFISKQILYRGFIFRCAYCRNADWFSVGEITQEFRCRRCGRNQVYTKQSWKMPEEPAWFYKLDELIYQGYRQGMAVSLLALAYLKTASQNSFTYATDREFWRSKAGKLEVEADFFCVPDGLFTIGEAKTENSLGNGTNEESAKISKYKHLVSGLSARQLVFATLASSWRRATVEAVKTAFSNLPHVRLLFLDASQLLRKEGS